MSGTGETVLGEAARGPGWDAFAKAWGERRDMGQCYAAAFEVWQQHVAALVAQARADGEAKASRWAGRCASEQVAAERLRAAANETCRRCRDLGLPIEPATVILWGKLLPPEHLGPRCDEHAAEAIGWDALRPDQFEQWAGFDLRPFRNPS